MEAGLGIRVLHVVPGQAGSIGLHCRVYMSLQRALLYRFAIDLLRWRRKARAQTVSIGFSCQVAVNATGRKISLRPASRSRCGSWHWEWLKTDRDASAVAICSDTWWMQIWAWVKTKHANMGRSASPNSLFMPFLIYSIHSWMFSRVPGF